MIETRRLIKGELEMSTFVMTAAEETRFNELMKASYRKVFNMAYRLSGTRPDAEDLTQEAYYRAYRSFEDYEGDRPFENWIFRIVTRLFLDMLRTRRRRVKYVSYDAPLQGSSDETLYFDKADDEPNPEESMLRDSMSEEVQRAMDSLNAEQRLLVTLADIEGMPYRDIAEIMGKPVGTIRSRLHRTHKQLRNKLDRLRREAGAKSPGLGFARSN